MVLCSEGYLVRAETLSHLISWESCLSSLDSWLTTVTHWTRQGQARPYSGQALLQALLSFALRPQWTSATFYCPQVANNRDPVAMGWRVSKCRCCPAFPQRVPSAAWKSDSNYYSPFRRSIIPWTLAQPQSCMHAARGSAPGRFSSWSSTWWKEENTKLQSKRTKLSSWPLLPS